MATISTTDKFDRLNVDNYRTWKFSMKMLLIQRGLWSHVDGTIKLDDNANAVERQAFKMKDDKALSMIALSIDSDQQIHIVDYRTLAKAWAVLK